MADSTVSDDRDLTERDHVALAASWQIAELAQALAAASKHDVDDKGDASLSKTLVRCVVRRIEELSDVVGAAVGDAMATTADLYEIVHHARMEASQ